MIEFTSYDIEPLIYFNEKYEAAFLSNQNNIEAMCLSTCNTDTRHVSSRYVNIKYIKDNKLFFFTNYESLKAKDVEINENVSCVFFWHKINMQIRIQGRIKKCNIEFSKNHFKSRSKEKNALAISSKQSKTIESYNDVKKNYTNTLENNSDLFLLPTYWGGFEITPFYFEFWEGRTNRLNKRIVFELNNNLLKWKKYYIQP